MQPNTVRIAVGAVLLTLAAASPLYAQQTPVPGAAEAPPAPDGTVFQGITPTGELINMSAAEITDRHVFTNDGEDLGEVERVVVGQADQIPHAVVKVGGFLGFGATPVAIPFDMLRLQGEDIYITRTFDEGQLKAQFPFSEARYRTVAENRIIADVIGAGATGQAGMPAAATFGALDLNRDGYITPSEATGHGQLADSWQAIDRNNDGLIDEAEFSAFEQTQAPAGAGATRPGAGQPMPRPNPSGSTAPQNPGM